MSKYGCDNSLIGNYTCFRTDEKITIDGLLKEESWENAPKSPRFVDMVTGAPGFWGTRMAALWDEKYLYLGFWVEEPNLQAKLTERDSQVYTENDIEVFIDGGDCYYEFQINALGTIYEVFFIWQDAYRKENRFNRPEFDLFTRKVDILGGFQDISRYKNHPRGKRWAFLDWDFPGLKTAVHLEGTINNNSDIDKGWTAELAFPWQGMELLAGNRSLPPREGDIWRIYFSRFEKIEYNGFKPEQSACWSFNPHGVYDSHIPECFTYVHFSTQKVKQENQKIR